MPTLLSRGSVVLTTLGGLLRGNLEEKAAAHAVHHRRLTDEVTDEEDETNYETAESWGLHLGDMASPAEQDNEDFGPCAAIWKPLCPAKPLKLQRSNVFMMHRYISVGLDLVKNSGRYYFEVYPGPGNKAQFVGWGTLGLKDEEDSPCTGIGVQGGGFSVNVEYQIKVSDGKTRQVRFGRSHHESCHTTIVGCAINFDTGLMDFSVNGEWIPDARINFTHASSPEMLEYGFYPAVTATGVFGITLRRFKFAPPDDSYQTLIDGSKIFGRKSRSQCRWPPPQKAGPCPLSLGAMSVQLQSDFQAYSDVLRIMHPKLCNREPESCSPEGIIQEQKWAWTGKRGKHDFNVMCEDDRITRLYLSDMRMRGTIPTSIARLDGLKGFYASSNHIKGRIPDSFSWLQELEHLAIIDNHLTGNIPTKLGLLSNLHLLDVSANNLGGVLPTELGNMVSLRRLRFRHNKLQGTLPTELGKLSNLMKVDLGRNEIGGTLPTEIGQLQALQEIEIYNCKLQGTIPTEISRLSQLKRLRLGVNQLTGPLPTEIGAMTRLRSMEIDQNELSGSIPETISGMKSLKIINFAENGLTGPIPVGLANCSDLFFICFSRNKLRGTLPSELGELVNLKYLWLASMAHKQNGREVDHGLQGRIPNSFGRLVRLQSLDISRNHFVGTIPSSLFEHTQIKTLFLHDNRLTGDLPTTIGSLRTLESLMIHNNRLGGTFPTQLGSLSGLRTLTAHDNFIGGRLPPLSMVPRAKNEFEDDHKHILTLYGNLLSCILPSVQQATDGPRESLNSIVVLGNMFDAPMPVWVNEAEKQSELLFNSAPGSEVQRWVLSVVLGCGVFMLATWLLFGAAESRQAFYACVGSDTETGISSIFQNVLRCCAVLTTPSAILMFVYASNHNYYECGRILPKLSIAYFRGSIAADWCVVSVWCIWLSLVAAFAYCAPYLQSHVLERREEDDWSWHVEINTVGAITQRKVIGWILVCVTLLILAWPSVLFVMINTMPNDNIFLKFGLNRKWRRILHVLCPLLQSAFDSGLAPPIFRIYHHLFQISDLKMLIVLRMMSGWVIFVVLGVMTNHNCASCWKYFWSLCAVHKPSEFDTKWILQNPFDASQGDLSVRLIDTERDICKAGLKGWWKRSLCDRSVMEHLATFVSQRLIVATAVQSIGYLVRWRRWQREPYALVQRQARIIPFVLQVAVIWVPFSPVLLLLVVTSVLAQGIVYDLCIPRVVVGKIEDNRLKEACFMLEYLRFNVGVCAILMARFALVSGMHGTFFMCAFSILILIFLKVSVHRRPPPWLKRLLGVFTGKIFDRSPSDRTRRFDTETLSAIELTARPSIGDRTVQRASTELARIPVLDDRPVQCVSLEKVELPVIDPCVLHDRPVSKKPIPLVGAVPPVVDGIAASVLV